MSRVKQAQLRRWPTSHVLRPRPPDLYIRYGAMLLASVCSIHAMDSYPCLFFLLSNSEQFISVMNVLSFEGVVIGKDSDLPISYPLIGFATSLIDTVNAFAAAI